MVTPCFSAKGRSVSVASSAMRDRSRCSGVKDFWSARLSRSSASVRSIARVLTAVEAVDEFAVVVVRIVAGHVEKGLGDRERGAQFVGGVGCESLLFGDCALRAGRAWCRRRRRVRGTRLCGPVARIRWESDPVVAVRVASVMRVRGASMRPARSHPPRRPNTSRNAPKMAAAGAKSRRRPDRSGASGAAASHEQRRCAWVGDVSQEEDPHGGEQQGAGEHEEAGVAEGEFEANAQTGGSIHGLLPGARCLVGCRCGSRRRPRWR